VIAVAGAAPTPLEDVGVPMLPGTRRAFGPREAVEAFLRIYQGGRSAPTAVSLTTTILDTEGRDVYAQAQSLEPASFGGIDRGGDVRFRLPLDRLAVGQYLLVLNAAAGERTARREVRFSVR
jgi:hypothetical protein